MKKPNKEKKVKGWGVTAPISFSLMRIYLSKEDALEYQKTRKPFYECEIIPVIITYTLPQSPKKKKSK